jgi:hypothetical protein
MNANTHYYSILHYFIKNQELLSLIDTNLIRSGNFGNEFNHDDNYGDYF